LNLEKLINSVDWIDDSFISNVEEKADRGWYEIPEKLLVVYIVQELRERKFEWNEEMTIKIGDVFWTCVSTIENQKHGSEHMRPLKMKVGSIEGETIILHMYDENTGKEDYDANAVTHAGKENLFETRYDALYDYKMKKTFHLDELRDECKWINQQLELEYKAKQKI